MKFVNVDLHSHYFPINTFQRVEKFRDRAPKVTYDGGRYSVAARGGTRGNLPEGAYNPEARIRELDRMGIDVQAISPSPALLYYWEDTGPAEYFSRLQNDAIQTVVKAYPNKFVGFGTVPLQNVPAAIAIAEEVKKTGLKGLEIGTDVEGKRLDDPEFEPFFEAAESLSLLLFIHPIEVSGFQQGDSVARILNNIAGFPYQTTLTIERFILNGMLEKYSKLRICLAHAGGFLPYNIWRLDHGYRQRQDLKKHLPRLPSDYLKHFYFDSIVHSVAALQFLVSIVGAERVVIGSDYPMLMGDNDPLSKISAPNISSSERRLIAERNAINALGMDGGDFK